MLLTVLAEPTCPNAAVLNDRLAAALRGKTDVTVSHHVVASQDEAAQLNMHGSPTLLIDGVDPFAAPDQQPSLSCRLYRDEDGHVSGAPSVAQLRRVIEQAARQPRTE
jgi:hypothetical protein